MEAADWLGKWNRETRQYDSISQENIDRSVRLSEGLIMRWGDHPAFAAFEPVNEPW